jgi:AAA15 family ATPase/GTPase
MNKLKKLILKNYCGYRDNEFDFSEGNGIKNISIFFGSNGSGKSSLLSAINLISNPYSNLAKDTKLAFRKLTYHPDYEPDYQGYKEAASGMRIEGIFVSPEGEKRVVIESEGVKVCELERKLHGHAYFIDADNPLNMRRFQVADTYINQFLEMASIIYGFKCEVGRKVEDFLSDENNAITERLVVYTDLVLHKTYKDSGDTVKVHFKNMSDGERKIATLLAYLFDPCYIDDRDIVLIDNAELHVHFRRHPAMIDKMLEYFPKKQFIITSHSGTMINHISSKYGKQYLYDLEEIKYGIISLDEWAY